MELDLILFDWGGTLAHVKGQGEAFRRGAERAGMIAGAADAAAIMSLIEAVHTAEEQAALDPQLREADLVDIVRRWLQTHALDGALDRTDAGVDALGSIWVGALDPVEGARETLATLRERGHRLGLVSNCMIPTKYALMELARHGLADLLDFTVFSSGVGYRKPSPHIYEAALQAGFSGNRPESLSRVLFVGDSPGLDIIAPASMGMRTALVRREPGVWPEEDYARARPDLRLRSVAELPGLLA